jgi:hypothetical protein
MMQHFCSRLTRNSETPDVSTPRSGLNWRFICLADFNFSGHRRHSASFRVPPALPSFLLTLLLEERISGSGSGVNAFRM